MASASPRATCPGSTPPFQTRCPRTGRRCCSRSAECRRAEASCIRSTCDRPTGSPQSASARDMAWRCRRTAAGRSAARGRPVVRPEFVLLPLGSGDTRTLDRARPQLSPRRAEFLPGDTLSIPRASRFARAPATDAWRTYVQAIDGGQPRLVEHEPGAIVSPFSPDGTRFVSKRPDGSHWLATLAPGPSVPLPVPLTERQYVTQWTVDGRGLFIATATENLWSVARLDLASGRLTPIADLVPRSPVGMRGSGLPHTSRDGQTIVVNESSRLTALYVVDAPR